MLPILAVGGYALSAAMVATITALHKGKAVVPRVSSFRVLPQVVVDSTTMGIVANTGGSRSLHDAAVGAIAKLQELTPLRFSPGVLVGERPDGPRSGEIFIDVGPLRTVDWVPDAAFSDEIEFDEIRVREPDDDHEIFPDPTNRWIDRASIRIDPMRVMGRSLVRIVAHQLVHVNGFEHVTARLGRKHAAHRHVLLKIPKSGHLMHPSYEAGGWGVEGLDVVPAEEG